MIENKHIPRTLTSVKRKSEDADSLLTHDGYLIDFIYQFDRIFLLGDPGLGKTSELRNLFNTLWESKNENVIIPIFIDLKIFRPVNKLEDLILYDEWHELSSIIFILDGLDEIAEVHDFLSAFNQFLLKYSHLNYKYVVSCRTNIYDKYLVNLPKFNVFLLNDLTIEQSLEILNKQYSIVLSKEELQNHSYFQNPFFLNLFASFYLEYNRFPNHDSQIWDLYVRKSFEAYQKKFIKKKVISDVKLRKMLMRTALVNELMQKNFNDEAEFEQIHGEEWNQIIYAPFLKYDQINQVWSFSHRQIQEYFVAASLLNYSLSNILTIIQIENIPHVHPNMFNAASFLVNLSPDGEYRDKLVDWFSSNQIEVLINADADRINAKIRIKVFQDYFREQCLEKELWLNNQSSIDIETLAKFGNLKANLDYLMQIILSKKSHPRAKISAIELLKYFEFPESNITKYKSLFVNLLNNSNIEIAIRANVIGLIESNQNLNKEEDYIIKIILNLEDEDNKQINSRLLHLADRLTKPEIVFTYILKEFKREFNIVIRSSKDEVLRGNEYMLMKLIFKITNPDKLIQFLKYYPLESFKNNLYGEDQKKITNLCIKLVEKNKRYLQIFLKGFKDRYLLHSNEGFLKLVLSKSNRIEDGIGILLKNFHFEEVDLTIASLANSNSLEAIIQSIIKQDLRVENIERFRNFLSNTNNLQLAFEFEKRMIDQGIKFSEPLVSESARKVYEKRFKSNIQKNIDVLLTLRLLLSEISNLLRENNLSEITWDNLLEIERNWYEENGHWNMLPVHISILREVIPQHSSKDLDSIKTLIEDNDHIRFQKLKQVLARYEGSKWDYKLFKKHRTAIENWISSAQKSIEFTKLLIFHEESRISITRQFLKFQLIYYFSKKFRIKLDQRFLLESLAYLNFENPNDESDFEYVFKEINNKQDYKSKIEENLVANSLPFFSLSYHLQYALKNKLVNTFPRIEKYILSDNNYVDSPGLLKEYFAITNDIEFVIKCSEDTSKYICWTAIDILIEEDLEKELCITRANEHLSSASDKYQSNALKVLFIFNESNALQYYMELIKNRNLDIPIEGSYSKYDYFESIETIGILYEIIVENGIRNIGFHNVYDFLKNYVSNLSKKPNLFPLIQAELLSKKEKFSALGQDVFYINLLIEDSKTSYINAESRPLKLHRAIKLTDQLMQS